MKKALLYFCVLVVCSWSCRDDEPVTPAVDEARLVDELKEYAYFKEGTYWIYRDSVTGLLDSQYVYFADEGETIGSDGIKYYWFNSYIYSTRDSFEYHHWFNSSWTSENPYRSKVFRVKTRPGDYVGETILVEFPVVPGNQLYCGNNDTVISTPITEELQIGDSVYRDVITVIQQSDVTTSQHGQYQLAKKVGLLTISVGQQSKWQLLRYHIVN